MVNVPRVGFGDEQLAEVWHAPAETGFDSQDHLQEAQQSPSRVRRQLCRTVIRVLPRPVAASS